MTNLKRICLLVFILFLQVNSLTFATENISTQKCCYPDFGKEFCGKDTCEKFNRKFFMINLKLNNCLVRPANILWASVMPKYGMDRLQNVYNNVNYPIRLVSSLVQKDTKAMKSETVRFLTNTTIGLGGMYDPALNKFKIKPCKEDMAQALAHLKIKQGPYLVLPVVRGNIRDLIGKLLDCPLRPTAYVGPFGAAVNALFSLNNTTYTQPLVKKVDETFADPYQIARQVDGIDRFIKNNNYDRDEVFNKLVHEQNYINIRELIQPPKFKADIELENFNPQDSLTDSIRTAYFDNQKLNESKWSEMSVWNRHFYKKLRISSVNIFPNRKNYKFKYILQKEKNSPIAIIYPSIGDGIASDKSLVLAKILHESGYSVIIQGSAFNWEFIKSMPEDYRPGIPVNDAKYLKLTSEKIVNTLQNKTQQTFSNKILIGCSFGALTGLFVTADNSIPSFNIDKCIAISPPVDILYAMKQMDTYAQDWKNDSQTDIKVSTALASQKLLNLSNNIYHKNVEEMPEKLPLIEDESKLIISFLMKQKLYDTIFAIENYSRSKKSELPQQINNTSFSDYAQKYLLANGTPTNFYNDTNLYSLQNFFKTSDKYKIYETFDDYFINNNQLNWLKDKTQNNSVIFSNGSHLGYMYRKEFLTQFKKDIILTDKISAN